MEDTADGLWRLLQRGIPGTYHLEGNDACTFFALVDGLNRRLRAGWHIKATQEPAVNIRMQDDRIHLAPVSRRL